ncbi:MAG: tol-pal system protein YbgF [Gemmatimonadota bacterium]
MRRSSPRLALVVLSGACATPGQVRKVETQLEVLRTESSRRDSTRGAELTRIITLQQRIMDSLAANQQSLRLVQAKFAADFTEVQRQLLQVQALTGQSQQRLSELKAQLDQRAEQQEVLGTTVAPARPDTTQPGAPAAASADQMYQSALQQVRRGSLLTARRGFQDFLQTYPGHPLVPDAIFYIGETFETVSPDSAAARYNETVSRFPQSPRAPTAVYRIGKIAEKRNDTSAARAAYQRVIQLYPRSDEADLARDRLAQLKP